MKHTLVFGTLFMLTFSAAAAEAQNLHAGVDLRVLPAGKIKIEGPGINASTDTAVAFGFVGHVDYVITPNIMVGLMPQLLLNVKGENANESAKELDLMARVAGGLPMGEVMLFGYLAPGYSFIFIPDADNNPKGLVLDFGFGGSYSINEAVYFSFDAGYQLGFQSVTANGQTGDIKTSFLHLGAGIGARF